MPLYMGPKGERFGRVFRKSVDFFLRMVEIVCTCRAGWRSQGRSRSKTGTHMSVDMRADFDPYDVLGRMSSRLNGIRLHLMPKKFLLTFDPGKFRLRWIRAFLLRGRF